MGLYVIRHGQTDWNREYRLQGRKDISLNEVGRKEAKEAGFRYQGVHFDICYCSPLKRAKETAELLLEGRSIPVFCDERLLEMNFGEYEGVCNCAKSNLGIALFFRDPEHFVPGVGGESFKELYERTGAFLREVALPLVSGGKDVLIVGHGAMNNSIVAQIKGLPLSDFWKTGIVNCELIKLL